MHGHLRQDRTLKLTVPIAAQYCQFYAAMGNTKPPILNLDDAIAYEREISAETPEEHRKDFLPFVVVKVREDSKVSDIIACISRGYRFFKFYPFARTTHADDGIKNYMSPRLREIYEAIASRNAHSLWHCEHPLKRYDDMECEYAFLGIFEQIYNLVPSLMMCWEHLSDARVLPFLLDMEDRVACTVTVHHQVLRLNDVLGRNHNLCRPPAKTLLDMETLRDAVTSGRRKEGRVAFKIMLGLDDAPWDRDHKECGEASCGDYTMPAAVQRIVQIFDEDKRLFGPDGEASPAYRRYIVENAAAYYHLAPTNGVPIVLRREPYQIPFAYRLFGDDNSVCAIRSADDQLPTDFVPFMAGAMLDWTVDGVI
jgi:dihydroorotase